MSVGSAQFVDGLHSLQTVQTVNKLRERGFRAWERVFPQAGNNRAEA
jgi:hypothetical protein